MVTKGLCIYAYYICVGSEYICEHYVCLMLSFYSAYMHYVYVYMNI